MSNFDDDDLDLHDERRRLLSPLAGSEQAVEKLDQLKTMAQVRSALKNYLLTVNKYSEELRRELGYLKALSSKVKEPDRLALQRRFWELKDILRELEEIQQMCHGLLPPSKTERLIESWRSWCRQIYQLVCGNKSAARLSANKMPDRSRA